jgi:argininosuccinate lyase
MSQIRGRFKKAADKLAARYTASLPFDWRLYPYDIAGSIAHARMLAKQKIISPKESEAIIKGLKSVQREIEGSEFEFKPELEDIHMAIEARLMEKVGEAGGKLHTARSRNDQVALDLRLFALDAIASTISGLRELQGAIVSLAEANKKVIIPGYTHLQPAQPVLLAHHLLAYFEMLQRDIERFVDCFKRTDVMPLGSGALAGVAYKNIDREFLAKELGFSQLSQNSIDAVSDRDFVLEYEAAASLCMMHLSRLAEEIILWSSAEFNFIELDEAYATGSSIMPQKKNPDVAELARGKVGRVYGSLMALLTTMKALPLSYNRDMQEDKEGFFDAVDTVLSTLEVFAGMIKSLRIKTENARQAVERGYILATDLADYLVKKGEAFRTAHALVARLVSYAAEKKKKSFGELSIAEYKKFSPLFGNDVYSITVQSSLAARDVVGGTAPKQVARALSRAKKIIGVRSGR